MSQFRWMAGLLTGAALFVTGCTGSEDYQDYQQAELSDNTDDDHHGGHAGVHGGHVLEVGDTHQYHAELVFDADSRDITVYFYGSEVGTAAPAKDFVFELDTDTGEVELESTASPLDGETSDTASRYVIAGANVPAEITGEEQINGHFHVSLGGEEYAVSMTAHSHDHEGHGDHDEHGDHGHEDHESHGEGEHEEHGDGEHAEEGGEHAEGDDHASGSDS